MKKLFCYILSVFILLQCCCVSFAVSTANLYAEDIELSEGETVLVPVKLSGNSGIMGFKITVEYPYDFIDIISISRGEITAKGNFNTNLGVTVGVVDVLWNNVEDIRDNGTLFVITLTLKKEINNTLNIKLSYSQPDTFNESWEDVKLNCQNIEFISSTENSTKVLTTEFNTSDESDSTSSETATKEINNSQIIDAVKLTLLQEGLTKLSMVVNEENFLSAFNKNYEILTGNTNTEIKDIEDLKEKYETAYAEQFESSVSDNLEPNFVEDAVHSALNDMGKSSIKDLSDSDKEIFISKVENNLRESYDELPSISQDIDTKEAVSLIEEVLENATNETGSKTKFSEKAFVFYLMLFVVIVIVLFVIIKLIVKKKIANNI